MSGQDTKTAEAQDDLLAQLSGAFAEQTAGTTNLPAIANGNADLTTLPEEGGGLSYATARPDEREAMDRVIAAIDLQNPDSIIAIGADEYSRLGALSDKLLDSLDPDVKVAFAITLKKVIEAVHANSLDEIKAKVIEAVQGSGLKRAWGKLFGPKELTDEQMIAMIRNVSTNITEARKVVREMVDRLSATKDDLIQNFDRVNTLGGEFVEAAQKMRIVRAATAEFIRRIATGENTIMVDLATAAWASGRADDLQKLQTAMSSFSSLRNVDGQLLISIGTFDMNTASMAFTREANIKNRAEIAAALNISVNRWKAQMATYAVMMVEQAAQKLIGQAHALDRQSIKNTADVLEQLINTRVELAGANTQTMQTLMDAENRVAGLLEGVVPRIEAIVEEEETTKAALQQTMTAFNRRTVAVFTNNPTLLSPGTPKAPKP